MLTFIGGVIGIALGGLVVGLAWLVITKVCRHRVDIRIPAVRRPARRCRFERYRYRIRIIPGAASGAKRAQSRRFATSNHTCCAEARKINCLSTAGADYS